MIELSRFGVIFSLIVKKSFDICEMEVTVLDGVLCIYNFFFLVVCGVSR